jgi:PTH1 family peptidyl-tRNA hydrolase
LDGLPIKLIVGLGNPGPEYSATRHNAGAWLVEELAKKEGAAFQVESKFFGQLTRVAIGPHSCWLLLPTTYMNLSGKAVAAVSHFYRITPQEILVVHDELDLPVGTMRLKKGGGAGGHNGLTSIFNSIQSQDFARLRVGIGRPARAEATVNYVLQRPTLDERITIDRGIEQALKFMPDVAKGDIQKAMKDLHTPN